ncbi:MAG: DegV family protein [Dehalococcoidaceae bacterium]|nr:DegV family protein [Dehalococcoidaceae bacterium]
MTIGVVTDSTADLPAEAVKELDIHIVPAYIVFDNKTYRDGVDICQDELYHRMVDLEQTATTSQPPPSDFADLFSRLLKEHEHIISIQVTSKLSGIFASAVQARDSLAAGSRITVIDSETVSMALGLLTQLAARLARAGENAERIVAEIRQNISRTHIWAAFDTLKYLQRGGRIGRAKALLGSVLNIKPLLTIRQGEIHPLGVARTRSRAIEKLVELCTSFPSIEDMAVVYSTTPRDAGALRERLSGICPPCPISISRLGPALGVHGGPGTLVVALREKAGDMAGRFKSDATDRKKFNLPAMPEIRLPKLRFCEI